MWRATANKTVVDPDTGDELLYSYAAEASTEDQAVAIVLLYVSMIEYGMTADKYAPKDMAFPREQLYQYIQKNQLDIIESMYPDAVSTAYSSALAYVQSYIGAMFDVEQMLESGDTSSTALTLRLALCISTATYVLASSPQYAETIEMHNRQLQTLLKGLKTGNRNMGKAGIAASPNVRASVVVLHKNNTP